MNEHTIEAGIEIEIPSDDARIRGAFYSPATGRSPALVLVPDVYGISALYREIAAKLAAAGFRTLVLDIYSREGAPRLGDMAAVQSWIENLPDARVLADIEAAVRHLERRPDVTPNAVGIVGFCLGGQYAIMAACRISNLAACVAFYGMLRHGRHSPHKLAPPLETAGALLCPLLGLFGADDPLIPQDDVHQLRSLLTRNDKSFELHVFAGAGHAFANDRRPDAFRPAAAAEALSLTITFLHRWLA